MTLPFCTDKDRKGELDLRKDMLIKYFPDWPIDILLEERPEYLKSKDHGLVRCVGRKSFRRGYIYQFEWCESWRKLSSFVQNPDLQGGLFTVIGGKGPNEHGYWHNKGFFRGLSLFYHFKNGIKPEMLQIAFVEVPDPDIWLEESHSDRFMKPRGPRKTPRDYRYSLKKVKGVLRDLEYATLASKYDFVVSETDAFYHDMISHVGRYIKYDPHQQSKRELGPYLKHYETYQPKSELLEYIFGYTADTCLCLRKWNLEDAVRIALNRKTYVNVVEQTFQDFLASYQKTKNN